MVAFCCNCNHSLPFADVHIVDGEEIPEVDYECPHCEEPAGERAEGHEEYVREADDELIIDGQVL